MAEENRSLVNGLESETFQDMPKFKMLVLKYRLEIKLESIRSEYVCTYI